jgi:acetyl-CoA acyltransferase
MDKRVSVVGLGLVPFGRHLERTLRSLAEEAASKALKDAGSTPDQIDAVFFSNSVAGLVTGQEAIRGQTSLRGSGLLGKPIFNVDNACASGSSAFLLARAGLLAGIWRRVLVVGAEKLAHREKSVSFKALAAGSDVSEIEGEVGTKSLYMDVYAERMRTYMGRSGATQEDFAAVVVKNREHAMNNPIAHYRSATTVEDVLQSREVAWPLTLFMCAPISDGAAALVLALNDGADYPNGVVEILASQQVSDDPQYPCDYVARAARMAYEEAGVGPADIDLVELHDAAAPGELQYSEALGLCAPDEGPELFRSGSTRVGGRLPINPGGGLVARGHPLGATGVAQLAEITLQLRGQAGRRQVAAPRIGLVQNSGGSLGGTSAASAVHILARG